MLKQVQHDKEEMMFNCHSELVSESIAFTDAKIMRQLMNNMAISELLPIFSPLHKQSALWFQLHQEKRKRR